MIGQGSVRQPVATTYPLVWLGGAVAHAVRGGKVLLDFHD